MGNTSRAPESSRLSTYTALRQAVHDYITGYPRSRHGGFPGLAASFSNGPLFQGIVNWMLEGLDSATAGGIDYVGGPEAGAWGLAGSLSRALTPRIICVRDNESVRKVGLLMIHKYGRPEDVPEGFVYGEYETGGEPKILAMPGGIITPDSRVILIDDWAETYTQLSVCTDLVKAQGGFVAGAATVVAVCDGMERFLERHPEIKTNDVFSLINYRRNPGNSLELVD